MLISCHNFRVVFVIHVTKLNYAIRILVTAVRTSYINEVRKS
jgi:hypothetical protein